MALSLGGNKNKSKQSQSQTFNQSQNFQLSDRAAGYLTDGIRDASSQTYNRFDPSQVGAFESPYTQDVIDASLGQADHADAMARAQQQSDFGAAGAFGDKRRGIYEAELGGAQSRDRASLIASLRDKAYTDARGLAVNENSNANQFDLAVQALLAQLRGGFANEGTTTNTGTSNGVATGTGMNLGFSWASAPPSRGGS